MFLWRLCALDIGHCCTTHRGSHCDSWIGTCLTRHLGLEYRIGKYAAQEKCREAQYHGLVTNASRGSRGGPAPGEGQEIAEVYSPPVAGRGYLQTFLPQPFLESSNGLQERPLGSMAEAARQGYLMGSGARRAQDNPSLPLPPARVNHRRPAGKGK